MATMTRHEGRWRRLANLSADRKGSIHDDEAAQGLGFRAAFVPGSTVGTAAMPALIDRFGTAWFEGGWYSFTFVSPVYTDEEVREVGEPDADCLAVRVETRDGRLCCSGRAGLGFDTSWDRSMDGRRGAEAVLPAIPVGLAFDEGEFRTSFSDVEALLAAAGDESPWFRESTPLGAALLPPERLHNLALQLTRGRSLEYEGIKNPGMWAQHDLAVRRPLMLDRSYRMTERVADKGRSGRTVFLTYEFEVFEGTEQVACGRHKIKWLAEE